MHLTCVIGCRGLGTQVLYSSSRQHFLILGSLRGLYRSPPVVVFLFQRSHGMRSLEQPQTVTARLSVGITCDMNLACMKCQTLILGLIDEERLTNDVTQFLRRILSVDPRMVLPPFLMGLSRRTHAAVFSFIAGVIPPMAMLGRSLL